MRLFNWRYIKAFPQFTLVVGVLVVSTVLFTWWWLKGTPEKREQARVQEVHEQEVVAAKVAVAEDRIRQLFLADNDLYDVETGEVIFKDWISGDWPTDLFYEASSKKLLATFPLGLVRYGLDGVQEAELSTRHTVGFTQGFTKAMYPKDKDVWMADVDLKTLKLANEHPITTMGIILEQNFAENLILATDKVLIVRNLNQQLRINLETGYVKPSNVPTAGISKRRSPDGTAVVGQQGSDFYFYDVDKDEAKHYPIGRIVIGDSQWLDNNRCVLLMDGNGLSFFDRTTGKLEDPVKLLLPCKAIVAPSPNGRHMFCLTSKGLMLLDLETMKFEALPVGVESFDWVNDDTLLFPRTDSDSTLRGTWLKKVGKTEQRITPEPCFVERNVGPIYLAMKKAGQVVFITRHGICRVKPDGSDFAEIVKMERLPRRLKGISEWGSK